MTKALTEAAKDPDCEQVLPDLLKNMQLPPQVKEFSINLAWSASYPAILRPLNSCSVLMALSPRPASSS